MPAENEHFAYISCGTWGLVGVELDGPVLTEEGRAANFTNERGVDGTVRFLRNVMGLWLLQECLRDWEARGIDIDLDALLAAAARLPAGGPSSTSTGRLPARRATCRPGSPRAAPAVAARRHPAEIVRCILDSLAAAFAAAVHEASRLSGEPVDVVHLVGGGSRNALLCQFTADACGLPVVAGPVEATAIGNIVVQARTHGVLTGDIWALRALIRATHPVGTYQPRAARRDEGCAVHRPAWSTADARRRHRPRSSVLRRAGVEVEVPLAQTCCGQMHINTGYPRQALAVVRNFVETFERVRRGRRAVRARARLGPAPARRRRAREFGDDRRWRAEPPRWPRRPTSCRSSWSTCSGVTDVGAYYPHRVTYHPTCHSLRVLRVGDQPLRLLRDVEGIELVELPDADQCCGFGGTFAVKNRRRLGGDADRQARARSRRPAPSVCSAGDSSCLLHIGGGLSRRASPVRHRAPGRDPGVACRPA